MAKALTTLEKRFLDALSHHMDGWAEKVKRDFSAASFDDELAKLRSDPVYERFGFDCGEYVLVRLIGRMSISVGRRLGEIYDKIPRFVAGARFNILAEQVAEMFDGLEIDIVLRDELLNEADSKFIRKLISRHSNRNFSGLGIEIRYNFNPNDSSRLRKDESVAAKLAREGLFPVYLIFSSISPRSEAIARLTRGGWYFLQGKNALDFLRELLGVDLMAILNEPAISKEVRNKTQEIMASIFYSDAVKNYKIRS